MAALIAVACAAPPAPAPQPLDRDLALATFDTAWSIVHRTHFDTTFNGVDWTALRDELRPRIEAGVTLSQLRSTISDMLGRLEQSHFALIPEEAADALDPGSGDVREDVGEAGIDFRLIDSQVVVTRVTPSGAADLAGVEPGWVVYEVSDEDVADIITSSAEMRSRSPLPIIVWARVQRRLGGRPGDSVAVTFLDDADRSVSLALVLQPTTGQPVKLGNLPTFFARFESETRTLPTGGTVGVIWFSNWMVPLIRQVDEAVDRFRNADGIIVDLRGNGGGVGAMVMGVAGHFLDERVTLGTMKARTTTLNFVANPRRVSTTGERVRPYDGPVAVLTDGMTGSASEVFAGGLQAIGRVRVFGETSAGAVLPASMDRLPDGDVLYHAFADFVTADSTRLEGRGVIPDEPVTLTRQDYLAGRDPALAKALEWIAQASAQAREY